MSARFAETSQSSKGPDDELTVRPADEHVARAAAFAPAGDNDDRLASLEINAPQHGLDRQSAISESVGA